MGSLEMGALRLAQHAGYIFIVRTAMTPTQVESVQESSRWLLPRAAEASRIFYDELFRSAPELRGLFPEELNSQKDKFTQMLGVIVKNLSRIGTVSEDIVDLGRRHMSYDVEEESYEAFGEALLRMLDKLLGSDMTPELRDAWAAAYEMLTRVMQDAANTPRPEENFFARIIRDVMTAHYGLTLRDEGKNSRVSIAQEIESGKVIKLS